MPCYLSQKKDIKEMGGMRGGKYLIKRGKLELLYVKVRKGEKLAERERQVNVRYQAIEQSNEAQRDLKQPAEQCRQLEEFRQQLQQQIQTAELTRKERRFLRKHEQEFEAFKQEEKGQEYRGYSR